VLTNGPVMFCLFTCMLGTIDLTFWQSYLPVITEEDYGIGEDTFGYIMSLQTVTYVLGCFLMPYTCEHLPRRFLFIVASFLLGINLLLLGPSKWFGFPDKPALVIAAFPMLGVCQVFVFIPIIPEVYDRLKVKLNIKDGEDEVADSQLNDKVNDAYGFFYALSMFAGPLIGNSIANSFKPEKQTVPYTNYNRVTSDIFAVIMFVWALILFIFNGDWRVFQENRAFMKRIKELSGEDEDETSLKKSKTSVGKFVKKTNGSMSISRYGYMASKSIVQKKAENLAYVKGTTLFMSNA